MKNWKQECLACGAGRVAWVWANGFEPDDLSGAPLCDQCSRQPSATVEQKIRARLDKYPKWSGKCGAILRQWRPGEPVVKHFATTKLCGSPTNTRELFLIPEALDALTAFCRKALTVKRLSGSRFTWCWECWHCAHEEHWQSCSRHPDNAKARTCEKCPNPRASQSARFCLWHRADSYESDGMPDTADSYRAEARAANLPYPDDLPRQHMPDPPWPRPPDGIYATAEQAAKAIAAEINADKESLVVAEVSDSVLTYTPKHVGPATASIEKPAGQARRIQDAPRSPVKEAVAEKAEVTFRPHLWSRFEEFKRIVAGALAKAAPRATFTADIVTRQVPGTAGKWRDQQQFMALVDFGDGITEEIWHDIDEPFVLPPGAKREHNWSNLDEYVRRAICSRAANRLLRGPPPPDPDQVIEARDRKRRQREWQAAFRFPEGWDWE